jgi:hypothetical protein
MDADPSIFIIDLHYANKKQIFLKTFSAYYFLKVLFKHFTKVKSHKEVTKTEEIKVFLTIFA